MGNGETQDTQLDPTQVAPLNISASTMEALKAGLIQDGVEASALGDLQELRALLGESWARAAKWRRTQ